MHDTEPSASEPEGRPPSPGADAPTDTEPPERLSSSGLSGALIVEVIDAEARLGTALGELRLRAHRALTLAGATGEVAVRVIGDAAMTAHHERHIGFREPTDVLTFDFREQATGPLEADVLVCLDEAERRAAEMGHDPLDELLLYVIHGALHCLGYDDHDEEAARAMHAREDELLEAIGVGAIYARDGARPGGGGAP